MFAAGAVDDDFPWRAAHLCLVRKDGFGEPTVAPVMRRRLQLPEDELEPGICPKRLDDARQPIWPRYAVIVREGDDVGAGQRSAQITRGTGAASFGADVPEAVIERRDQGARVVIIALIDDKHLEVGPCAGDQSLERLL